MVMVVVFAFSVMRCLPLRRALAVYDEQGSNVVENYETQFVTFIVIPKPPLLAVVIVPRGFCPKMRPC